MKREDRQKVKKMIQEKGYTPVIAYESLPFDKQIVDIIYVDMDGNARRTKAYYHREPFGREYFVGMEHPVKCNRMANVVAWRYDKLEFLEDESEFV